MKFEDVLAKTALNLGDVLARRIQEGIDAEGRQLLDGMQELSEKAARELLALLDRDPYAPVRGIDFAQTHLAKLHAEAKEKEDWKMTADFACLLYVLEAAKHKIRAEVQGKNAKKGRSGKSKRRHEAYNAEFAKFISGGNLWDPEACAKFAIFNVGMRWPAKLSSVTKWASSYKNELQAGN